MSVPYNLARKLEWMSRRLRWIDDAIEIREWLDAMSAINKLITEVPREPENFTDGWRPYKENEAAQGLHKGNREMDVDDKATNDERQWSFMPKLKPPVMLKRKASKNISKSTWLPRRRRGIKDDAGRKWKGVKSVSVKRKRDSQAENQFAEPRIGKADSGNPLMETVKEKVVWKIPSPPKMKNQEKDPTKSNNDHSTEVEVDKGGTDNVVKANVQEGVDVLCEGSDSRKHQNFLQKEDEDKRKVILEEWDEWKAFECIDKVGDDRWLCDAGEDKFVGTNWEMYLHWVREHELLEDELFLEKMKNRNIEID